LESCFASFFATFGGLSMVTPLGPDRVFLGETFAGALCCFGSGLATGASSSWVTLDFDTFSLLFYLCSTTSAFITTSAGRPGLLGADSLVGSGDTLAPLVLLLFSTLTALSGELFVTFSLDGLPARVSAFFGFTSAGCGFLEDFLIDLTAAMSVTMSLICSTFWVDTAMALPSLSSSTSLALRPRVLLGVLLPTPSASFDFEAAPAFFLSAFYLGGDLSRAFGFSYSLALVRDILSI
jgi:hypothetical protein